MKYQFDEIDGIIMSMRARGYKQNDIAKEVNLTQSAISQRLKTIRKYYHGEHTA